MRRIIPAAVLLLVAAPLPAQQTAPRPLSLADALRVAEEHNPAYRKALVEVETAEAERRSAWGAFLPALSLDLSSSGSFARTYTGRDQFGQPVRRDNPETNRSSYTSQSLSLRDITLFDGGAKIGAYRAARVGTDAARAHAQAEVARVRGEVERRYYAAQRAELAIALEERLLAAAGERLDATRRLLRIGVRNPVDVLGAEVRVAEQEGALERARGEHRKARLALREQMGVIDDEPVKLAGETPALADPAGLDVAALVAGALERSPRMAGADAAARRAAYRLQAARATRWPTLSLSAGLSRGQYFEGLRGLSEVNPLNQEGDIRFSLSVPLFSQFRTSYQVSQARAGVKAAEADTRAERLALEREVRGALIDLENAYRAARNAERSLALGRRRLELAQQQYRLGSIPFPELQDAAEGSERAERDALATRYEYAAALAMLEEKAGARVPLR
jgi:outer membrane protein